MLDDGGGLLSWRGHGCPRCLFSRGGTFCQARLQRFGRRGSGRAALSRRSLLIPSTLLQDGDDVGCFQIPLAYFFNQVGAVRLVLHVSQLPYHPDGEIGILLYQLSHIWWDAQQCPVFVDVILVLLEHLRQTAHGVDWLAVLVPFLQERLVNLRQLKRGQLLALNVFQQRDALHLRIRTRFQNLRRDHRPSGEFRSAPTAFACRYLIHPRSRGNTDEKRREHTLFIERVSQFL